MAGLTGKTIGSSFPSLLRVDDNSGVGTSSVAITDGEGNKSCLQVADDYFLIQPQNDDSSEAFKVKIKGGSSTLLAVNTSNNIVRVNLGQQIANTQYAYFGVNFNDFSHSAANTHYAIQFSACGGGASGFNDVDFGTGTDPNDTFTTANTDTQYASQIVPCMWFVPDNISIDSVTSIEGADAATGDTTRMHLKSFTFSSGATSCLSAGALLAHNSDVTNAGNEQAYKTTWTVDSEDVAGGKVILAFIRSDSVNSDYSLNITIKYHLR